MSASPPKADFRSKKCNVRFVPKADMVRLFEDFVGGKQKLWRDRQAQRFGSLQVDDEFVFGRLLVGQVAHLLPA